MECFLSCPRAVGSSREGKKPCAVGEKLDAPIPQLCKRRMLGFALSQLFRGNSFHCYLSMQDEIQVRHSLLTLIVITRLCLPAPGNILANEEPAGMLACVSRCVWVLQDQ